MLPRMGKKKKIRKSTFIWYDVKKKKMKRTGREKNEHKWKREEKWGKKDIYLTVTVTKTAWSASIPPNQQIKKGGKENR